jgi:methanogenic corrinoid protein MtbC1
MREANIKLDTLRAWERRYGLPNPQRTSGGHRLYSQYDIEMIKWLIRRQGEGLRINRAVDLWRSLETSGQDPLEAMPADEKDAQQKPLEVLSGATLDEMREKWIAACMDFNERSAENVLAQALASYPQETVVLELLRKGLSEIGDRWYTGMSTVQQEHFASALAMRRLHALLAAAPAPTRRKKILIGCPPGEEHEFSPLLIALLLRNRGWQVVYLGVNVPLSQLDRTIASSRPDLVISTAQQLQTAASLYDVARYLVQENLPLAYGGLVFNQNPQLRERIPGYFLGESLEQVVQSVESIIASPIELPELEPLAVSYQEALAEFRDKQISIEAFLWKQFQANGMKEHHLEIANQFLGRDIEAGLILGDLSLLNAEMKWIYSLLDHHEIPTGLLPEYIKLYQEALKQSLDEQGQLIIDWFGNLSMEEIK